MLKESSRVVAGIEKETEEVENWLKGLEGIAERIRCHFARKPMYQRAVEYIKALLGPVERKNGWQMAEALGEKTPDNVQYLLVRSEWDENAVRDDLQVYVKEHFAEESGVMIVDETGFVKKGSKSVGVQRQYSGTAGRIENCQIGVFLGYSSQQGYTLIDRELYLPKIWAEDETRRQAASVPETIEFQTKPQLGRKMLERAIENDVPFKWTTADEVYGDNGRFRQWLEENRHAYVLAVACDTHVWMGFEELEVRKAQIVDDAWQCLSAGDGSKGPRWYDWSRLPLNCPHEPEWERWLLIRRSLGEKAEQAYYLVFAPAGTTLEEMVKVAGQRWRIEGAPQAHTRRRFNDELTNCVKAA